MTEGAHGRGQERGRRRGRGCLQSNKHGLQMKLKLII
jgi:hypothetical protein